ncbi:Dot/Icm T4SS effector [Legionella waltersii]|nr:Dot/Icm T4SS effector [Legionella waltersii]
MSYNYTLYNFSEYFVSYTIDNPGGGDCGFYAFAIGLINIIQHEYELSGSSATFEKWQHAGLKRIRLQDILSIDLNQLMNSPYNYKSNELSTLQMSLRLIAVNAYREDLLRRISIEREFADKPTTVEGSPIFAKFMQLVQFYKTNPDSVYPDSHFNELALSPEVVKLAKETAKSVKGILQNQDFAKDQRLENKHVKEVFLRDVVLKNGLLNPDSVILAGTDKIQEQGRWATHSDLREITGTLHTNLYVNGHLNGPVSPHCPTVKLNNHGNAHWTTEVDQLPKNTKVVSKKRTAAEEPESSKGLLTEKLSRSSSKSDVSHHSAQRRNQQEQTTSSIEEQVIEATISTQTQKDKVERYRENIKQLIQASSGLGLFANVKNKIDINDIDSAEAVYDSEKGAKESDESFAARLQEAELRRAKLK